MKIGILTYHRSHNYGALLQAIGLRVFLQELGFDVYYIDYWPKYHKHIYSLFSFDVFLKQEGVKGKLRYIKKCANGYKEKKIRYNNFQGFIKKYICPHISSTKDCFDVIVHGSDQIWRKQPEICTFNPVYFGKSQIKAQMKISYAASMGILDVDLKDRDILKEYISCLDIISVREIELLHLVENLGFSDVRLDPDPALLLSGRKWAETMNLKEDKERYVLYYKIFDSFDERQIKKFADMKGCSLKIVYSKAIKSNGAPSLSTIGPDSFLSLIYNASFVFTSSYHGLVFSLLFHKLFYASFSQNAGRAVSLLNTLGLQERLISPYSMIPEVAEDINFKNVDVILSELRIKTKNHFLNVYNRIANNENE